MTGSTIGIVFAFFSYRQYYPSLASALSHRPYSPRIPSLKTVPAPIVDIEQGNVTNSDDSEDDVRSHGASRPINKPFSPGRPSTTYLAPSPQSPSRPSFHPGDRESYEMDATSVDGTVKRPRQDLEQEWKKGGEHDEQL